MCDQSIHHETLSLSGPDQASIFQQIVDLVAADSPLTEVTRQVSTFHEVINCRRAGNERILSYVTRFHGKASFHLVASDISGQ